MPELPDLEVMKENLRRIVLGERIRKVVIVQPAILKSFSPKLDSIIGQRFTEVDRRGKHLILSLDSSLHLVLHLMLSGWLSWVPSANRITKPVSLIISFDCGSDLRVSERGHKKRAKAWLVKCLDSVPAISEYGIEPLSKEFTPQILAKLVSENRLSLKRFLTDQKLIAGIGNTYADEILYKARLSPFKSSSALSPAEAESLHRSVKSVLAGTVTEMQSRVRGDLPKREVRDFLRVRNRKGDTCEFCGNAIAEISYRDHSTFYCPGCQTGGKILKDRRYSAFLK